MADLRQLRYFVTLAETLHFGRAAERLHLSQPPLSRQIAALEKSLGVQLLERDNRHTRLTHAGQRFLEDARAILTAFDQACENARRTQAGEIGELRVGFMMHAAFTVVPALARKFMATYPEIKLHLRETLPSALPDAILAGEFDAGILFFPGRIKGLEHRVIHRESLCFAVPECHPLADRAGVRVKDLRNEGLIAASEDASSSLREAITGWFRAGGAVPVIRLEAQLQQTLVSLVAEEVGVALVPESMKKLAVANVSFVPLVNAPKIETVIAWQPGNLNPSLKWLLGTA
ncbi:MAG: LysR substrate-binding domain-containing protein [Luteolibacter sp.]